MGSSSKSLLELKKSVVVGNYSERQAFYTREITLEKHLEDEDVARLNIKVRKDDEDNIPHYIPILTRKENNTKEDLWL